MIALKLLGILVFALWFPLAYWLAGMVEHGRAQLAQYEPMARRGAGERIEERL